MFILSRKYWRKRKEATAAASSASKLTSHVSKEKEIEKREKISSQNADCMVKKNNKNYAHKSDMKSAE